MRRTVLLFVLFAACGDATGVGEVGLRDGAQASLTYTASVFYDCSEIDTTGSFFPIPQAPRDSVLCGASFDTLLVRHDTLTATAELRRVEGRLPLIPGAVEFDGAGSGRYAGCPVDQSACTETTLSGQFVISHLMVPCLPPTSSDSAIQRDVYLPLLGDLRPHCERSGRDSLGVAFVVFGDPLGFAGTGVEVGERVEGVTGLWLGRSVSDSTLIGVPGLGSRELPDAAWTLSVR